MDGRAADYLSEKLFSLKDHKSYDTRSRLSSRLPVSRTNSMKRMYFFDTVKLWNNISDIDLVFFSDSKEVTLI